MPFIEATYKKHGIAKVNYALIKDRSLIFSKKEQLFGTQFHLDTVTKQNVFYPILRVTEVDKRRSKMGYGKLKFYAQNNKVSLPENYKP